MEKCSNCGRVIGKLEQAFIFCENVVCGECDLRLRKQIKASIPTAPSYSPSRLKTDSPDTALIIISFLIPLAGIIIGAIYCSKPKQADKKTGESCLIWAVIGIVSCILFCALLFN